MKQPSNKTTRHIPSRGLEHRRLYTTRMAGVVFSDVATEEDGLQGTLFKGLKFWVAQRVPQRSRFVADIKVDHNSISQEPCVS